MRFYKLRVTPNAASIASEFNEQFKPESMTESNDLSRIDWIRELVDTQDFLVGEKESELRILWAELIMFHSRLSVWKTHKSLDMLRDGPSMGRNLTRETTLLIK